MTQPDLVRKSGLSASAISDIETDQPRKRRNTTLLALARAFGYATWEEARRASGLDGGKVSGMIPVFDEVPAGDGDFDPQAFGPDEPPLFTLPAELFGDRADPSCFGVRVKGDSMMPDYAPGDTVICSLRAPHSDGMDAVVRLSDGKCSLKRVERADAERVRLVPLNPRYNPTTVLQADIVRIARVVAVIQRKGIEP